MVFGFGECIFYLKLKIVCLSSLDIIRFDAQLSKSDSQVDRNLDFMSCTLNNLSLFP